MKTLYYAATLVLCTVLNSCQDQLSNSTVTVKPRIPDIQVVNCRITFKNTAVFKTTLNKVGWMNDKEFRIWHKNYEFSSLRELRDTLTVDSLSIKRLPNSLQSILNQNAEFVIGDTIVWFTAAGVKHYIPNLNEQELSRLKSGGTGKLSDTWEVSKIKMILPNASKYKNLRSPIYGTVATYQKIFYYRDDGGSKRKYVNELYTYWSGDYTELWLRIKLEWWGNSSNDWHPAGDWRDIAYDLNYECYLLWGSTYYGGTPYTFNGTLSNYVSTNTDIQIKLGSDNYFGTGNKDWIVTISGDIFQGMWNDYPYNFWDVAGNPLW